ncbi:hypothetical protein [Yinghuangia sp. YIM S09857]|uniref:hypothetical protein n=1 Tax=Yinghuangia sp. YIM S09857 TaxID=3436929 RepID=UPI003F539474
MPSTVTGDATGRDAYADSHAVTRADDRADPRLRPHGDSHGDTCADALADSADELLRTAVKLDAWAAGAFGVFLLALGSLVDGPLGLPLAWSVPFGVAMLGGALALALIAGYRPIPASLGALVFACNAASSVALAVLAFVDLIPLTGWGSVFMLSGAAVVGAFATAEYAGFVRVRTAERDRT